MTGSRSISIVVWIKRDRRSKVLRGQQARPEEQNAYGEESDKLEDDSTADGELRVTPFENRLEIEPDFGLTYMHRPTGK